MSILLQVPERVEKEMLLELCARGRHCEIVYRLPPDRKIQSKVRLLELSDSEWLTDLPTYQGRPALLPAGQRVRFYFLWKERRYTAVAVVRRIVSWPATSEHQLSALAVDPPSTIEKTPPREGFRLSMVDQPDARIALEPIRSLDGLVDPALLAGSAVELPTSALRGRLLNLSETGCCGVFAEEAVQLLVEGQLYTARFRLATEAAMEVIAEIRWIRSMPGNQRVMAGMAWQLDPDLAGHRCLRTRIERFVVQQQERKSSGRGAR